MKNYWIKSGFFALTQRLSIRLVGVVSFVILIRLINEDQMGVWSLFLGISTMFEMLRNGLLKSAFVKYYTESDVDTKPKILTSSLMINLIFSLILCTLLLLCGSQIASWLNAPDLKPMLDILAFASLIYIPFSHFEYLQQGEMSFKGVMWSYVSRQLLLFLLILVSTFGFFGPISTTDLAIFYLVSILLGGIVSFYHSRKYLKFTISLDKTWNLKIWRFGRYGFLSNIGTSLLNTADHYLIGGLIDTRSVAVYNVASRTTNIFTMPSVAIADILYPKTVSALTTNGVKEVKKMYENAVGAILAAMIPSMIFVLLLPELIIKLIAGSTYLEAKAILQISIISIVVRPFIAQFGTIVNTLGKPNYNFIFVCSLSLLGIVLNYLFITKFGLIGAAIANLATLFVGLIVSQIILFREAEITFIGVLACTKKFLLLMPKKLLSKLKSNN